MSDSPPGSAESSAEARLVGALVKAARRRRLVQIAFGVLAVGCFVAAGVLVSRGDREAHRLADVAGQVESVRRRMIDRSDVDRLNASVERALEAASSSAAQLRAAADQSRAYARQIEDLRQSLAGVDLARAAERVSRLERLIEEADLRLAAVEQTRIASPQADVDRLYRIVSRFYVDEAHAGRRASIVAMAGNLGLIQYQFTGASEPPLPTTETFLSVLREKSETPDPHTVEKFKRLVDEIIVW